MKNYFFALLCFYCFTGIASAKSIQLVELIPISDDDNGKIELTQSEVNNELHYIFSIKDTLNSCFADSLDNTVEHGTSAFPNALAIVSKFGLPPCTSNTKKDYSIDLGPLGAGTYTLTIRPEVSGRLPLTHGRYNFKIPSPIPAFHETPAPITHSGVGTIRGWVCDAEKVEIAIDDEPRWKIPYKGDRGDTKEVCGDTDNGYSMAMNWGRYSRGWHSYAVYADNIQIDSGTFRISRLDEDNSFIKGLKAEYTLSDFPVPGQNTIVTWSEADQNFIITNP